LRWSSFFTAGRGVSTFVIPGTTVAGGIVGLHSGQTAFSDTVSVPTPPLLYCAWRDWVTILCWGLPAEITLPQLAHR
jgi:hypothetical protein